MVDYLIIVILVKAKKKSLLYEEGSSCTFINFFRKLQLLQILLLLHLNDDTLLKQLLEFYRVFQN